MSLKTISEISLFHFSPKQIKGATFHLKEVHMFMDPKLFSLQQKNTISSIKTFHF